MATRPTIDKLPEYVQALELEDKTIEITKQMDNFYPTGNTLRRSACAATHFIAEAHDRFSYTIKIQNLQYARIAAETVMQDLKNLDSDQDTTELSEVYKRLAQQLWDMIKDLQKQSLDARGLVEV